MPSTNEEGQHEYSLPSFNPSTYRPIKVADALVFDRGENEPALRYVITTEASEAVLAVDEREKRLWDLIDGTRSVDEICMAYLREYDSLALTHIYSFLQELRDTRLLTNTPPFADVTATQNTGFLRLPTAKRHPHSLQIPGTKHFSAVLAAAAGQLPLESPRLWIVLTIAIGAGLVAACVGPTRALWTLTHGGGMPILGGPAHSYPRGLAVIFLLVLLCSFYRELVLAAVEGRFTGRYLPIRLGISHGIPSFDRSRKWRNTLPSTLRLVTGSAGIVAELLAASVCAGIHLLDPPGLAGELLYKLMMVLYMRSFFHFSPFPGSDLHGVLGDWSSVPEFRKRAFGFLRYSFVESFLFRTKRTREHWLFAGYILACVLWLVLFVHLAVTMIPDDLIISVRLQQTGPIGLLLVALFIAPILGSIGLFGAWMAFFSWRFVAFHPRLQRANDMLAAAGAVLAVLLVVGTVTQGHPRQFIVSVVSAGMMLAGAVLTYRFIARTNTSALHAQLTCVGLALLCGGLGMLNNAFWQNLNLALMAELWLFLFLIPPFVISVAKKQFFLVFSENEFRFPYLLCFVGFAVLAMVGIARFFMVNLPDPSIRPIAPGTLLAYSIIPLALFTFIVHLRDVSLTPRVLIIDKPWDDQSAALVLAYNRIRQHIRDVLRNKFGDRCLHMLELRSRTHIPTDPSCVDRVIETTSESIAVLSHQIRDELAEMDTALAHYFGHDFSLSLLRQSLTAINYEGLLVLQRHVLRHTEYAGTLRLDLLFDADSCDRLLNSIAFFRTLPTEDRKRLAQHMTLASHRPDEKIVQTGEKADACYIIIDGGVQVEQRGISGERRILAFMGPGDFFGESALLDDARRIADVRATADTALLVLRRSDFDLLADSTPHIAEKVRNQLEILHFLFSIRLFADLPPELLRNAVGRFQRRSFEDGQTIVTKGARGREFFVIESGTVDVVDIDDDTETLVRQLGVHDYFGEIALIADRPRTMTVRARGAVTTLVLGHDAALRLIGNSQLFAKSIEETGQERLAYS